MFCLDEAEPRHAPLAEDSALPEDNEPWTWLPLAPQQAAIFGWQRYEGSPEAAQEASGGTGEIEEVAVGQELFVGPPDGYQLALPDGVASRVRFKVAGGGASLGNACSARSFAFRPGGACQTPLST